MIRPVLYVDLPGIIHALDRRARLVGRPFAQFVCAPDYEETHSGLAALIGGMLPVRAMARTWICEEHWRLLGLAQAYPRPQTGSWDLHYLASLTDQSPHIVLGELVEYAVNAAMMDGMQRVFARIVEDSDTLSLFSRVGFQRYAQELLYVRETPVIAASEPDPLLVKLQPQIRRWNAHDTWGLTRLHDATTPRKVTVAEHMSSDELAHQMVPRKRAWRIPGVEPRDESYVVDLGSHLAAWVRVRQGWAGLPHQLWLKVHPEHTDMTDRVLRFALQRLCQKGMPGAKHHDTPVICHIRDYDGAAIDGLRRADFTHVATKAILVRHLTLRTFTELALPAIEHKRLNYGVEGLGSIRSTPIHSMTKDNTACNTRSLTTSISSSPRCRRASRKLWHPLTSARI